MNRDYELDRSSYLARGHKVPTHGINSSQNKYTFVSSSFRITTSDYSPLKDFLTKITLFLKILSTSISWHFLKLQNENPRWPMWKHPNCKWLTRTERTEPYPDPTQILFQLTKREIKDLCKSVTEQQPDSDVPFYLIDLNDVQEKVWLIYYN